MILNDYPVKSILDIKDGGIWKEKSIAIGTKQYSLDDIQHTILVKELNEPRVHFVLFSGAISSPKLHNEAFTAANLNVNLEKLTKGFVNSQQNTFSKELTEVSMIFKWYETDFGNLVTFINKYAKKKLKFGTEITFSDYNWDLFEPKIIYYP
jgi:hypothetical protein